MPEFYRMVRWWCRNRSNTFHGIMQQLEEQYPDLKQRYDDEESLG